MDFLRAHFTSTRLYKTASTNMQRKIGFSSAFFFTRKLMSATLTSAAIYSLLFLGWNRNSAANEFEAANIDINGTLPWTFHIVYRCRRQRCEHTQRNLSSIQRKINFEANVGKAIAILCRKCLLVFFSEKGNDASKYQVRGCRIAMLTSGLQLLPLFPSMKWLRKRIS